MCMGHLYWLLDLHILFPLMYTKIGIVYRYSIINYNTALGDRRETTCLVTHNLINSMNVYLTSYTSSFQSEVAKLDIPIKTGE